MVRWFTYHGVDLRLFKLVLKISYNNQNYFLFWKEYALMSQFTADIKRIEKEYIDAQKIKRGIDRLLKRLGELNEKHIVMLEAQQLLSSVSDKNTTAVLDYITGIINKTLGELFPFDSRRIYLEKTLYQGQYAHINLKLTGSNGKTRDILLQSGTGIGQVISFLFVLCIIEIRKGRKLLLADELLNGLHPKAKKIVMNILSIFAEEGYQLAFVEYGVDDIGKIYLVEKPGAVATVTPLDKNYNNEVFVYNRPPEDVDLGMFVDEYEPESEEDSYGVD